jgi:hypothetical protein
MPRERATLATATWQTRRVTRRRDEPPPDLDLSDEPDWAERIRRGREERGERLRELLGDEPPPVPTIQPPPVREDAPRLEAPDPPRPPDLRVIRSIDQDEDEDEP